MMKRFRLAVAIAATTGFVVTGCSTGASVDGGTAPDTQRVVVALSGDIDNFDPHNNQLVIYQSAIKNTVFDTLVGYDESLDLVPRLAKSWEVSPDATEFTFSLVDGATFHDGTPVNAEAVVANLERVSEQESVWAAKVSDVAGYEALDELTVKISLHNPSAAFLDGMAHVSMIAPTSFDDAQTHPVGSGPFEFVSWSPNEGIVLERNDEYFGTAPVAAELEFRPVPDQQVALTNTRAGEIDIVLNASTATTQQAEAEGLNIVDAAYSTDVILAELGGRSGKLDDRRVRQALAYALDQEAINDIEYGGAGTTQWSPLPAELWAASSVEGYPYNLDAAQALLDEAGVTDLTFTVEVLAGGSWGETTARVWQESLSQIGVDLEINVSESSVWLDKFVNHDYDAILNAFPVGAEPHTFFDLGLRPHLDDDQNWYNPDGITELMDAAAQTPDQDERIAMYAELQEHLVEELPVIPVLARPLQSVTGADIQGLVMNPIGWGLFDQVSKS